MNTCRKSEGGEIKCSLGLQCRSVEIRGKSLESIIKSRKSKSPISNFDIKKDYDLFVVLSNPGNSDDFNGGIGFDPAFRKLINLITEVGFSPEKVFVSYIARCNPPKGRKPSVQEIQACLPYLYRDLENTNPKVVMLLGTLPLRLFRLHNKGGINKIRGQRFLLPLPEKESPEYNVIPSVDPGIFAYSTDFRLEQRVLDDYRKAFSLAMGNTPQEKEFKPSYKVMDKLHIAQEFIDKVKEKGHFTFDTESRSLPWSREPLICVSFSLGKDDNYIFPWYQYDPTGTDWKLKVFDRVMAMRITRMLKPIFEDPEITTGAHNWKYDYLVIKKHLGIETKGFVYDSLLLHHLLIETPPHDLEYCADVELGVGNYCLAMGTKILKADLSWTNIENLSVGDEIVGIDEKASRSKGRRRLRKSIVESIGLDSLPCYKLEFDDGRILIISSEHKVLARHNLTSQYNWLKPDNLTLHHRIMDIGEPWEKETDFDSGWLSGIFDGEGSLDSDTISFSQKKGDVLNNAKRILDEKGFRYTEHTNSNSDTQIINVANILDRLRLLGSLRPIRLLKYAHKTWVNKTLAIRDWVNEDQAKLTSISFIGMEKVVTIGTSTKTLISEGFISHNSEKLHKIIGVGKDSRKPMDNVPDDILWLYAIADAECTDQLIKIFLRRIKQKPHLWKLYLEEVEPLIHSLADAEWHGYPINQNILKELQKEYSEQSNKQLEALRKQTWDGFNPNSPNQVIKALQQAGFAEELRDSSKATGYSASKNVLLNIKEKGSKIADDILKYRKLAKISGTYLNDVENNLDSDGRVRYSFFIHGTLGGRASCRFFHQAPRVDENRKKDGKKNIRDMLVCLPGCKIVGLDYSQIELRMLAVLSKDEEMLRLFREGADIHKETAATLLEVPTDKINYHNRQFGKNFGFSLVYGGEGFRILQTNTWMDEKGVEHPLNWDILNRGIQAFKSRFPGIMTYLETVPEIARSQNGVFVTPFGRERRMGDKLNDKREGVRKAAEREIVNFSIQSPAGAVMMRTINIVHKWIMDWRVDGLNPEELWLLNTVHDSGYWNCVNRLVSFFKTNLKKAAERPIPELDNYQFPVNIGVGSSWTESELKEE